MSPLLLNVTLRYPKYFPNVKACTTNIFFDGLALGDTRIGYGPLGTSIDGGLPIGKCNKMVTYYCLKLRLNCYCRKVHSEGHFSRNNFHVWGACKEQNSKEQLPRRAMGAVFCGKLRWYL